MVDKYYNKDFYSHQAGDSYTSARELAPMVLALTEAKSIVDVGCGAGTWLKAFSELGIRDYLGIDGGDIGESNLLIPAANFSKKDLNNGFAAGKKTYDLALSLEVAEHLSNRKARAFVANLTALSEIILFSAAIPKQGGDRHLNEQFPGYWKMIFKEFHYELLDPFRFKILNNHKVAWWYRQNILLAVSANQMEGGKWENVPRLNDDFILIHKRVLEKSALLMKIKQILSRFSRSYRDH